MKATRKRRSILALLISIAVLFSLYGCRTKYIANTEYVSVRDSIVKIDTVYVKVRVGEQHRSEATKPVIDNSSDVIMKGLSDVTKKLARQSELLKQGKLSIDTVWTSSGHAKAWSYVRDNQLYVGLLTIPIDTTLAVTSKSTTVNNHSSKANEVKIVTKRPTILDPWFWSTIALLACLIALALYRLKLFKRFNPF